MSLLKPTFHMAVFPVDDSGYPIPSEGMTLCDSQEEAQQVTTQWAKQGVPSRCFMLTEVPCQQPNPDQPSLKF